jgi:exopolysaccharide biosynthesis WecB/TagA/CpsF family protein
MSDAVFHSNGVGLALACESANVMSPCQRVMIYLPELKVGGAELSMVRLAIGLAQEGCVVTLVLHAVQDDARVLASGLPTVDLGVDSTRAALPRLARLLRRERPDVLIAGLTHNNIMAVAAVLMSGRACRLVLTEHAPVTALARARPGWRYRVLPWLLPFAYGFADAVVAVSKGVADDLISLVGPRKRRLVQVIYNPVLTPDWRTLAESLVDDPWFDEGAPPIVLTVGRLSAEKNLPLLLDSFVLLRERGSSARLVIIGDGAERANLKERIERESLGDCVRLLGQSPHVLAYMRRSKVFVLTSSFEGFGNVLVEAMAAGIPVVSTDCPVGPREILADGRYGELVPQDSAQSVADAIARALISPGDLAGAQERAQEFTVGNSVRDYRTLFAKLGVPPHGKLFAPPRMRGAKTPINVVVNKSFLFGIGVDAIDMDGAVARILGWIEDPSGPCRYVVTANINHIVDLNSSQALRRAYKDASMVLAEGRPIIWASRLLRRPLPGVVPGSDLVPRLFDDIDHKGGHVTVYLLGAPPGVVQRAFLVIQDRWRSVTVVGMCSPPFGFENVPREREKILAAITAARPDILIIGLDAPKQERWIHSVRHRVDAKVALCVGASIAFLAGEKPRAPLWMHNDGNGLESLHRILSELRRLSRSDVHNALVFPGLLARELVSTLVKVHGLLNRSSGAPFNGSPPAYTFGNLRKAGVERAKTVPTRAMEVQMIQLMSRIDAALGNGPPRLLQFLGTSCDTEAQDVAYIYASMCAELRNRRVLLIFAEDCSVDMGLLECLRSGEPLQRAVQSVSGTLSYAAFRGAHEPAHAAHAMMTDEALWGRLRSGFDEVVVGSRTPHASQFGLVTASNVDAVMIVVATERTHLSTVRNILDDLQAVGANVLGAVVNQRCSS